jgi:hypothetical protein
LLGQIAPLTQRLIPALARVSGQGDGYMVGSGPKLS